MSKLKPLSWKPVRRGPVFCSPACGRGCTIAEHDAAVKKGTAIARRLGDGWKVRVWENLGWHQSVISPKGTIEVFDRGDGSCWATTRDNSHGQTFADGRTPKAAIRNLVAQAEAKRDAIIALLEDLGRSKS